MVFYAAFNSISVISRRQLTLFMLSWVSPVLGWALKYLAQGHSHEKTQRIQCLAQGHSHEKTQRIQCGSNPGPLEYESNTLPLSHVGTFIKTRNNSRFQNNAFTHANNTYESFGNIHCIFDEVTNRG